MNRGVDISHWQGNIDFSKLKKTAEFAILKAGGSDKGFYKDSKFEEYYKGCKENNIKVGAYYYVGSKCISFDDGVADANRFLSIIKDKQFEYPVYIDLESTAPANKKGATDACIGFCRTLEANGYYAGIYASDISGFKDRLELTRLQAFDKWVARYGSSPKYVNAYGMWQYSSEGNLSGVNGKIDLDLSYINYPEVMKRKHLNGF